MMTRRTLLACLVTLSLTAFAQADQGNPKLKSIEKISFGPDGLLLIGDSKGSQIVTVETGDLKETTWTKTEIADIDQLLAGKLGLMASDIQILKVAVNPASRKAYVAVRSMKSKQDILLTVDGTGKIEEFSLENVKFSRYPLAVNDKAITTITDITWAGDRVLAAVQASDKFAARIFLILPNAKDGATCYSTDTYHVAHSRWETNAPIRTIIPYEENGKKFLVGAFTCTPIVKYSLDEMQPNAMVKGSSIVELGSGNTPRDMFTYEKGGKKYILINTFRFQHKQNPVGPSPYWASRVDYDLLKETENVNAKALWRIKGKASVDVTDRAVVAKDYFGVHHMSKLDNERALAIRENDTKGFDLRVLQLP